MESITVVTNDKPGVTAHPIWRYFARLLDTLLVGNIVVFALVFSFVFLFPTTADSVVALAKMPGGMVVSNMLVFFTSLFVNAAFIGLYGCTLGKLIFGIRIVGQDGKPIGYVNALKRELDIFVRGLALGIPFILVLASIFAFVQFRKTGTTLWDKRMHTTVLRNPNTTKQKVLTSVGLLLYFAVLILLNW